MPLTSVTPELHYYSIMLLSMLFARRGHYLYGYIALFAKLPMYFNKVRLSSNPPPFLPFLSFHTATYKRDCKNVPKPRFVIWWHSECVIHDASLNTWQQLFFCLLSRFCQIFVIFLQLLRLFFSILCSNRSKTTLPPPRSQRYLWERREALSEQSVSQVRRRSDVLLRGARLLFISCRLLHPSCRAQSGWAEKMIDRLGTQGSRSSRKKIIIKACGRGDAARRDLPSIWYQIWASSFSSVPNVSSNCYILMIVHTSRLVS